MPIEKTALPYRRPLRPVILPARAGAPPVPFRSPRKPPPPPPPRPPAPPPSPPPAAAEGTPAPKINHKLYSPRKLSRPQPALRRWFSTACGRAEDARSAPADWVSVWWHGPGRLASAGIYCRVSCMLAQVQYEIRRLRKLSAARAAPGEAPPALPPPARKGGRE